MTTLSREIASWLQSNPGPIKGPDDENVWLQAKLTFMRDRRWRQDFDISVFMQHLNSLGYRTEHRTTHGDPENSGFVILALPAHHRGF